jgi:hypothetical protein
LGKSYFNSPRECYFDLRFRFGYVRLCTHTHTHTHTCTQPVPIWAFYLITITLMGTNIYYSIIYTIICIGDQDLKHTGPYDAFYTQSLFIINNKILVT